MAFFMKIDNYIEKDAVSRMNSGIHIFKKYIHTGTESCHDIIGPVAELSGEN